MSVGIKIVYCTKTVMGKGEIFGEASQLFFAVLTLPLAIPSFSIVRAKPSAVPVCDPK